MSLTDQEIHFLTLEELVEIHHNQVGRMGGQMGLRHEGVLRACLATPANKIGGRYAHQDIYEMAAAYLFHITDQRPFLRGNQKVAVLACLYFLYLHDIEYTGTPQDLAQVARDTAQGRLTKIQIADFLRRNSEQTH